MLFRAVFVGGKLALLGLVLVILGHHTNYLWSESIQSVGLVILLPLCAAGILLGFAIALRLPAACPICKKNDGVLVWHGLFDLGLRCVDCGVVHGNPLWNWKYRVSEASPRKKVKKGDQTGGCVILFLFAMSMVAAMLMAMVGTPVLKGFGLMYLGLFVVACAYSVKQSGVSKTNWGTAYRDKQPIRFYFDVLWISILGLVFVIGGIVIVLR